MRASLARLDEPARRAAELAAVAGRPLDRVELAALAPPEAVLAALDCGLFRSAEGRFGFRHDLLREAALADLDDARRALLHEALAAAPGVRAAEAARHLRLAGRDDLAVERLIQAAADAAQATALVEAVAYLEEAVELRPDEPRIHVELAGMLAQLGRRDPAMAEIDAALRLLRPDDVETRVQTHLSASLWFRSALCDPTRALRSPRPGSTPTTPVT